MRAILVRGPNDVGLVERPELRPESDEVLVRVEYCGICASDFEILHGVNTEEVVYPLVPGHEWAGRAVRTGPGFERLNGKRVTGYNTVRCGVCPVCRKGEGTLCAARREIGFSLDGAYAEAVVVRAENVIELPDTLDARTATLAEPLAVCLHAMRRARVASADNVLITGDGPIGLLCALLAARGGAGRILLTGHHDERLTLAAAWTGATAVNTRRVSLKDALRDGFGVPADVILETTGSPVAAAEAMTCLGPGATLCLVGSYRGAAEFRPNDMVLGEHTVVGSMSYTRAEMQEAVALLGEGLMAGKPFITHTFALADYARAFETVEQRREGVLKACFDPCLTTVVERSGGPRPPGGGESSGAGVALPAPGGRGPPEVTLRLTANRYDMSARETDRRRGRGV